mmetsp:Transcript_30314/g.77051  ORF Transcript_30314/g.77051 Transcript_30314/m.77051 type:complete len:982 (-) Transcript_30314:152-3097(-)
MRAKPAVAIGSHKTGQTGGHDDEEQPMVIEVNEECAESLGIPLEDLQKCHDAFKNADMDGSGHVNVHELRQILHAVYDRPLDEASIDELLGKYDKDKSGSLDFREFVEVFCNTPMHKACHLEARIAKIGREMRDEMNDSNAKPEDVIKNTGVQMSALTDYLKDEIVQMQACLQLPYAMLIFIAFTCSVLIHERVEELHGIDKAVTWDVVENANFAFSGIVPFENGRMGHKNMMDVNTIADFWSWLGMGLVPLFWPEGWDVNEARVNVMSKCLSARDALNAYGWNQSIVDSMPAGTPELGPCPEGRDSPERPSEFFGTPHTNTYLLYHSIVGGMRMRQEQMDVTECPDGDMFKGMLRSGPCIKSSGYWLDPELRASLASNKDLVDKPGGENIYFLSGMTQRDIRQQMRELENRRWLSPYTGRVELMYTTYNPHMDVFTATYIIFFINLGGHIYRRIQPVSFPMTSYHNVWCYIWDGVWSLMILKICIEETRELVKHWRIFGFSKGNRLYWCLENCVDWLNVAYFLFIALLWSLHMYKVAELRVYLDQAEVGVIGSWQNPQTRVDFYDVVGNMVLDLEFRRGVLACYPFIIVSRFFKAYSAQPRLALVTNTLSRAALDLVHFGLVFMSVFLLFTVSATLLFGRDVGEFATMERSLNSCFRCLLGDFEWDDMKETGRISAAIWFWSFTWLVNLVMLNMLLAIVMDVYTEVKGSIGSDAETLWSQASEVYRRRRQRLAGDRVSLNYVLECIEPNSFSAKGACDDESNNTYIHVAQLVEMVPGIKEKQAMRVLLASEIRRRAMEHESQSISEAMVDIQRIDAKVQQLYESFDTITSVSEMSATLQMAISKNTASQSQFQTEQKDADGFASLSFTMEAQGTPPWLDKLCEKQSSAFLERCDKLERQMDSRVQGLAAEVAKLSSMVHHVQAAQMTQVQGSRQSRTPGSMCEPVPRTLPVRSASEAPARSYPRDTRTEDLRDPRNGSRY